MRQTAAPTIPETFLNPTRVYDSSHRILKPKHFIPPLTANNPISNHPVVIITSDSHTASSVAAVINSPMALPLWLVESLCSHTAQASRLSVWQTSAQPHRPDVAAVLRTSVF